MSSSSNNNRVENLLKPKEPENTEVISRLPVPAAAYVKRENIPIISGESVYGNDDTRTNQPVLPQMAGSRIQVVSEDASYILGQTYRSAFGCNQPPTSQEVNQFCAKTSAPEKCKLGFMTENVHQENQCRIKHTSKQ